MAIRGCVVEVVFSEGEGVRHQESDIEEEDDDDDGPELLKLGLRMNIEAASASDVPAFSFLHSSVPLRLLKKTQLAVPRSIYLWMTHSSWLNLIVSPATEYVILRVRSLLLILFFLFDWLWSGHDVYSALKQIALIDSVLGDYIEGGTKFIVVSSIEKHIISHFLPSVKDFEYISCLPP